MASARSPVSGTARINPRPSFKTLDVVKELVAANISPLRALLDIAAAPEQPLWPAVPDAQVNAAPETSTRRSAIWKMVDLLLWTVQQEAHVTSVESGGRCVNIARMGAAQDFSAEGLSAFRRDVLGLTGDPVLPGAISARGLSLHGRRARAKLAPGAQAGSEEGQEAGGQEGRTESDGIEGGRVGDGGGNTDGNVGSQSGNDNGDVEDPIGGAGPSPPLPSQGQEAAGPLQTFSELVCEYVCSSV